MKFKKIMLVALLLLAVVTIGAVSASDDVASDNLTVSDDGDSIDSPVGDTDLLSDDGDGDDEGDGDGDGDGDDETDDDGDEDEGPLYMDEEHILAPGDREVVGLETGEETNIGRLVVFDTDDGAVYFNDTLSNMRYNTDWMRYKFNHYDGYYLFAEDLNVPSSGDYNINVTYYDDDNTIIETIEGTVSIDLEAFICESDVDVNDEETPLIGTYIFDWFDDGFIIVGTSIDEDSEILYKKELTPADIGTVINFTNKDLQLEVGDYEGIFIAYLPSDADEDDLDEIEFIIGERDISIVDNTQFRIRMDEDASIFDENEVLFVYCPESSANTNITIMVNDEAVITHLITEEECGDYVGFTLTELKIDDVRSPYYFDVFNDDGENLTKTYEYEFDNPFEFAEYCIIGGDDDFIVEFRVPEWLNEGRIIIKNETGDEVFNATLADMDYADFGWDEGFIRYQVIVDNLTVMPQIGINTYTAIYISDRFYIAIEDQVPVYQRNYVENDNATIDIFDYKVFDLYQLHDDEADAIAAVVANNGEGYVVVKLGEFNITLDDPEDDDGDFVYEVSLKDFEEFEEDLYEGVYEITVIYFDADDNEVLNLTGEVTLIEGKVNAEILIHDVLMNEGWMETEFIDLKVLRDFDGIVIIRLDDEEFRIPVSELVSIDDEMEVFVHYRIFFYNLDKEGYEAREYRLSIDVFNSEDDDGPIWGDEDSIFFYKEQINRTENVTIEIDPRPQIIPGDNFIYIYAVDGNDNVTISVNGEEPVSLPLADFWDPENEGYVIGSDVLELGVGEYTVLVKYQNVELEGNISLVSNVEMYTPDEDQIMYWGYGLDPVVAIISLRDGDMNDYPPSGKVIISVYLDGENKTVCFEREVGEIDWYGNFQGRGIRLSHLEGCSNLTGTYKFEVQYVNGTEEDTGYETELTFKQIEADDFGVDIDGNKIVFSEIPQMWGDIEVTVDGETESYGLWDLEGGEGEAPYIKIRGLNKGTHKVRVAFRGNEESPALVLLETVVNPIDSGLTISVANIEEGAAANVIIKTNATFSGIVIVQIGTKNYNVSVVNGSGSIAVANLAAGNYVATAVFAQSGLFANATASAAFTVTKKVAPTPAPAQVVKLTLKKIKSVKKSAKKLVLKATLKINGKAKKGLKVKFKFNKKKYTAKTNKKGIAKVTIKSKVLKKLKVGKKVKIQAKYGKVVKKMKVKVKK